MGEEVAEKEVKKKEKEASKQDQDKSKQLHLAIIPREKRRTKTCYFVGSCINAGSCFKAGVAYFAGDCFQGAIRSFEACFLAFTFSFFAAPSTVLAD